MNRCSVPAPSPGTAICQGKYIPFPETLRYCQAPCRKPCLSLHASRCMLRCCGLCIDRAREYQGHQWRHSEKPAVRSSHSSCSSLPRVVLCFSDFSFLRSGTTRDPGGAPFRSRAIAFTVCTALNLFFFLLGISLILP